MQQNTMWRDALAKEMYNVGVISEVLEEGQQAPAVRHLVTGHIVWDVKMDFTWKARWVLDGYKTPDQNGSMFAGVVLRESVKIPFTYAALNSLDICVANINNAYLQALSSQWDNIICRPEFSMENVRNVGKDFRNHLRSCMHHLIFSLCPADTHIWMRKVQKADGSPCSDSTQAMQWC